MIYHDNTEAREQIDELLKQNSSIQASLGLEHSKNSQERKEAKAQWRELLKQIKAIDPEFGKMVSLQDN